MWKLLLNPVVFLNNISNLQPLRMFFNDFYKSVLVCNETELSYRRTRTKDFLATVRVVFLTMCILSIFYFQNFQDSYFLRKFVWEKVIQCVKGGFLFGEMTNNFPSKYIWACALTFVCSLSAETFLFKIVKMTLTNSRRKKSL